MRLFSEVSPFRQCRRVNRFCLSSAGVSGGYSCLIRRGRRTLTHCLRGSPPRLPFCSWFASSLRKENRRCAMRRRHRARRKKEKTLGWRGRRRWLRCDSSRASRAQHPSKRNACWPRCTSSLSPVPRRRWFFTLRCAIAATAVSRLRRGSASWAIFLGRRRESRGSRMRLWLRDACLSGRGLVFGLEEALFQHPRGLKGEAEDARPPRLALAEGAHSRGADQSSRGEAATGG